MILMVVMDSKVHTYAKMYQIMYLNYVKFMVCQLYLNRVVKNKQNRSVPSLTVSNCQGLRPLQLATL